MMKHGPNEKRFSALAHPTDIEIGLNHTSMLGGSII